MEKEKIKTNSVEIQEDKFIITDTKERLFYSDIIKGSVTFQVFNENNQEVSIDNILCGDIILVSYSKPNKNLNSLGKKKYLINKIFVKNKYTFNSDSSDNSSDCDDDKYLF